MVRTAGRRYVETFQRFIKILRLIDGKKSITEIAKEAGIRRGTVSEYIDVLKELGLIKIEIKVGTPNKLIPILTKRGECFVKCFE